MPTSLAASRTPLPLIGGFALFLATIAYALAASFVRPSVMTFEPTGAVRPGANGESVAHDPGGGRAASIDTVTIDASDDGVWRYLDLEQRRVTVAPDTAGWDLAFRRHTFIAAAGVRDVGAVPWDSVTRAPPGPYAGTPRASAAADPALRRWYRYRMLTHVLESRRSVFVVRTAEGRYAKVQILSYYCPGPRAGCPTVRYSLPIADPR
jgi:hypothetical protein